MSTTSQIGIINPDNTVSAAYCHFDGYPENVGRKLNTYWRDPDKVKELIKLGTNGISFLGKEIGEKQIFENPRDGWTLFYGRDRGDSRGRLAKYRNVLDYMNMYDENYAYVFDPESNIWFGFRDRGLITIPGQSAALVKAKWKELTKDLMESAKKESFKFAKIARNILKEIGQKK